MVTIHHSLATTALDLTLVLIYKCKSKFNWFTKVNEMKNRLYQWCQHAHNYLSIDISRPAFFYCWITVRLISMQVLLCNAGYPPSWPILAQQATTSCSLPFMNILGKKFQFPWNSVDMMESWLINSYIYDFWYMRLCVADIWFSW